MGKSAQHTATAEAEPRQGQASAFWNLIAVLSHTFSRPKISFEIQTQTRCRIVSDIRLFFLFFFSY